jgi:hypothetical protein
MPPSLSFFFRTRYRALKLAYILVVLGFVGIAAQFYLPHEGFTYLVMFGEKQSARYLPELRALDFYELPDSYGYDAQFYAQIAMHPQLGDPELKEAVDNLPYRARRILFSWTAWILGLGNPAWALQIYAVQNLICWLGLALLLLRWLPPVSWGNLVRWCAVLFSYGLCLSVRGALVDGPSLLLIALGVRWVEKKRPWLAAMMLGVAGLGKETNVLGAGMLWPAQGGRTRKWLQLAGQVTMVGLPVLLWAGVLWMWIGSGGIAGQGNFAPPFVAYGRKWPEALSQLTVHGNESELLVMVALTTQFLFLVFRPRIGEPWWRVGIAYAVLMAFLGGAVWEGAPDAAVRVLLPMTLAFNLLVPRGRAWWLIWLLGNVSLLASTGPLRAPARNESYRIVKPHELSRSRIGDGGVKLTFDSQWFPPERSRFEFWRWSRGNATMTLHNPEAFPIRAEVTFGVRSNDARTVALDQDGKSLWQGPLDPKKRSDVILRNVILPAGDSIWSFSSDRESARSPDNPRDSRLLAFSVRDLSIDILGRAEP